MPEDSHVRMQVAAAATALNTQWKRLGSHVPNFFNRSPAGSETGEPSAKAAAPAKDPASSGPVVTSATHTARHVPSCCALKGH